MSADLVILSEDAAQFDILVHASCCLHPERPLARAIPDNEAHRSALEQVRQQRWALYQDRKAYQMEKLPIAIH
ncbi:MAG: hypothetical protein ACYC3I_02935 [Gemmataceae bacterium]